MSITLDVDYQDESTAKLEALLNSTQDPQKILAVAARAILNWLKEYHREFADKWKGGRYMAGAGSGQFAQQVIDGWQPAVESGGGEATIANIFPLFAHKVTGGRISPKGAGALTIPLIPEAKGRMAREFAASLGKKLFRVGSALGYSEDGKFVAAYALSGGVEQAPWPGAMPEEADIQDQFSQSINDAIDSLIQTGEVTE
jgi:hypothetical protein